MTMTLAKGAAHQRLSVRIAPPLLVAAVTITGWQLAVTTLDVESFVLPAPSAILSALWDDWSTIVSASWLTIKEILLGFLLGSVAGILVAWMVTHFRSLSPPVLTFAVVVNCAPIIALAPIFNNWFGVTALISKAAVAAVMVFFPVLVNTTRGLLAAPPLQVDVMRSFASSRGEVTRYLRLPNALPYLFSALKLASTLAVIGVIVAEYFGGQTSALGVYIAHEAAVLRFPAAWAGVVVASAIGLGLFGVVSVAERLVMPWHASMRTERH